MTKKETDYLPLWEPLDKSKETPVKKELTKAEEAEKKRKKIRFFAVLGLHNLIYAIYS